MFKKLVTLTDKFLDVSLELCACIPIDINMRKSIRLRTCVVDAFPQAPAARAFKSLAKRVLNWPIPDVPGGYLEFFVENLVQRPNFDTELGEAKVDQPPQPIGNSFLESLGSEQAAEIKRRMAQAQSKAAAVLPRIRPNPNFQV